MAFIHEHKVVPLEAIHRHGLVFGLVGKLVHVDDFHRLLGEHAHLAAAVLIEKFGVDAAEAELVKVLEAHSVLGGEQDDLVQLMPATCLRQVVQVLHEVDVHLQRLAAARGLPEAEFFESGFLEGIDPIDPLLVGIEVLQMIVQRLQQLCRAGEIPVRADLREEPGPMLAMLPADGARDAVR